MQARISSKIVLAAALSLASLGVWGQATHAGGFQPQVGQEGKDVIWVPTPEAVVERMLSMARVGPDDFVMDLGSGDGRIAIAAAKKFGARSLGIEYNPKMVDLSRRAARKAGVASRAKFRNADIFKTDFSKATVITMYLLPDLNVKLRPTILEMKPGTRIVSHQFSMGDWEPDESANLEGRNAYLWIVPAKVAGSWRLQTGAQGYDLKLTQSFQKVAGMAREGSRTLEVHDAKLDGDSIVFVIGNGAPREFTGRVSGDSMSGTVRSGGAQEKWTAARN